MTTKQDIETSSSAEKECEAVRRFRSSNDREKLIEDFYEMIRNANTSVAELESVIDVCPDILLSYVGGNSDFTPLHVACSHGCSKEVIELLVQRNPVMLLSVWDLPQNINGETPLHYACKKKCLLLVIDYLVQLYPQALQMKDHSGDTPLHLACLYHCSNEVIEFLVRQNPDALQVADSRESLPLHKLSPCCELSVVKLMIDTYPLSVEVQNINGQTPLHCACSRFNRCSYEVIDYLVQLYPQALEMKDHSGGDTPLHLACLGDYSGNCSNEVIEFLVRLNPDVLQVTNSEESLPLHKLSPCCELSVVELMVETYPLSVQAWNKFDETPLHHACEVGCSYEVIEYLFELYPQALRIQSCREQHMTPFHTACKHHGELSVIQLLYTAFPLAARWSDGSYETPLLAACCDHSTEVAKYLAYECWPLACPLLYMKLHMELDWLDDELDKCLEDVTMETVAALIDVAFRVRDIVPVTVTAHIAESVMPSVDESETMKSQTKLCPGQHCGLLLGTLNHHTNLDDSTVRTILESEEIQSLLEPESFQSLLEPESGHDELQELIDNVIRMNRAGRAYYAEDPENKRQGMKVLASTSRGLSGLFYHIRENPLLCKR